jgi:hypothetical protein
MVMVSRVFVNQRQVAQAMGKKAPVWLDAVDVMLEGCCRLLEETWSSGVEILTIARWLVGSCSGLGGQASFCTSQPCKETLPLPNLTKLLLSYTPSRARPFAALRTPFIRDSWPTCALGLWLSPFTRYLRKEM